jgi:hypothetical protein
LYQAVKRVILRLLLTFNVAECKEIAMQMFIFAKRAAPFKGKNLPLHRNGARDEVSWCSAT